MLSFLKKTFFTSPNQKIINKYNLLLDKTNSLEKATSLMSDEDIKNKTKDLKQYIENGKSLISILPDAFSLVREAAIRTLGQRHYDVQIIGGVVLHEGKIAEMRTGEGKTLTISLAAYLNALLDRGVHIVTVNDYLAKRDSQEMGEIYSFLGLTSGYINNDQDINVCILIPLVNEISLFSNNISFFNNIKKVFN